tara:strand:+ start:4638 stop:6410 length:1773 start_codon:yes stop_codon:yes gene_type:complete
VRVADKITKILVDNNIEDIFMVTGGAAMHLNDAFTRNKNLKTTFFHNEQACVMAAEAYARIKGKPAVVSVTAGPGGANTLNGIFGAWTDSIPVIVISGQVRTNTLNKNKKLRQLGDQEIDIIKIMTSLTKYSRLIKSSDNIEYIFNKAINLSLTGRMGPVWLDVPIDIQGKEYAEKKNLEVLVTKSLKTQNNFKKLDTLMTKLQKSKRPVILAGNGIHLSNQEPSFLKFIKDSNIPVVTGFNAHDLLWESHRNYAGRAGTIGDRPGNMVVECADLIIVLGSRLNIRQIGYNFHDFGKDAFLSVVDIDVEELNKPTLKIDLKINMDLKSFFDHLTTKNIKYDEHSKFLKWSKTIKKELGFLNEEYPKSNFLNPYHFANYLSTLSEKDDIIVTSDATACLAPFQSFFIKKGQRMFTNSGSGSMGYGLPAAAGSAIASNKRVICFEGDGSLQMNIQELATISHNNLNINIFVFNNKGYQSIRQTQKNYFSDNLVGLDETNGISFPDLKLISKAYNIDYLKISKGNFKTTNLKRLMRLNKPALFEVVVDPDQGFQPKVTSRKDEKGNIVSAQLFDMFPFIEEERMKRYLKIKNI